ncbi:plasmid pRiA4b ORF-3 family protein [Effusibacillus consociatus]|uniref:Plasmid pRiA4b ORF-3 family protein n=1 Tax=Effusibacillus consociatus TaxID=1117041 RepID=A0ABV9Q1T4_9BACL
MIYQFHASIKDITPSIWRRFQVDGSVTFDQLHATLQIVMGWEDYHLYQFSVGGKSISIPDPHYPRSRQELNAKQERLDKHLHLEGQKAEYLYDFGDGWVHELVLEKILPEEDGQMHPVCLEGERNCPPEDSGGVPGYQHILEVLRDPRHPDWRDIVSWLTPGFDPQHFSPEEVNSLLEKKAKKLAPKQEKTRESSRKPVKLTVAKLRKELQALSKEELIELLAGCFKVNKQAEQFLSTRFLGEQAVEDLFAACAKKVEDQFFPERGFGKLKLAEAKKAIQEFEMITGDKRRTLELKLLYVEQGVLFTNTFGDIDSRFYSSMESMFASIIDMINQEKNRELFDEYEDRLAAVLRDTSDLGWGFHENLTDIFYGAAWIE